MTFTYKPRSIEAWAARAGKKFDGEVSQEVARKFVQGVPTIPVERQPAPAVVSPGFVETRRAYIRCASCGHWRCTHCTQRKLKPGQVLTDANWRGFIDDGGQIQPCSHTLPDARPYACSSNACATVLGEGENAHYCPCNKFVSPFSKKKTAKPRTPGEQIGKTLIPREDLAHAHALYLREQAERVAPKVKTKADILVEVVREDPSLTVAVLADASGMSSSWVRKHLRAAGILPPAKASRKSNAFTTGQEPSPVVEA